jgi:stage V sporulation protein D (sporulation-specific penicillin-binding protein)
MAKKQYRDKVIIKKRMLLVFSILSVLFLALTVRLFFLMVLQSNKLKSIATEQWTSEVKIDAKRGRILDRKGTDLAMSANVYRIDLDMSTIRGYRDKNKLTFEEIAQKLASALSMEPSKVLDELNKKLPSGLDRQSGTLARRIEKAAADSVSALKINGVLVSPDTKRYYPNDNFLAHVLGVTDADGKGLTGVELVYENALKGIPGVRIAETDRRSSDLPYVISEFTKPVDGKDVVLSIDEKVQLFAEKAAQQALIDNKAKTVTIIVMDPSNGEVLAMANKPDFNPNTVMKTSTPEELNKAFRNRAVNDTYEPGSIFKVVTSVAAMEENKVSANSQFICNGSKLVANRNIHCWKTSGHGVQDFVDILKNSCNVGFMEVGMAVGKEKLNEYIEKMGFGQKTGIDLNGEAKGIVKPTDKISSVDLATISFGQSNTVTPIQYMAAFNSVANGGYLITPHVMKEITHVDENGQTIVDDKFKAEKKQIISQKTANTLSGYLEKVISEGGGKKAFIEGYHIAGKTGTAQKVNNGVYEKGKYVASFAGMAPASDPKFSVFISIDEPNPENYYAGQIAAPVAQQVFNDIFNLYSVSVDATDESVSRSLLKDVVIPEVRGMKKEDAAKVLKDQNITVDVVGTDSIVVDMTPKPGVIIKEKGKVILNTGASSAMNKEVVVPDLKGYNKERATKLLESIGLKARFSGEGLVSEQSINPYEIVSKGTAIDLTLDNVAGD